jgi:hypothetical protein
MINPVNDDPFVGMVNVGDDSVGKVDQVSDLPPNLVGLRNDGASIWEFFKRIDGRYESAKPSAGRVGFTLDFANEVYVLSSASRSAESVISTRYAKLLA